MNPNLRDRILRKLDSLSDDRGYQVLDYVDFLESRYAEQPPQQANLFQQFVDGVEDKLRAGKVSASTIAETMTLMNKAVGVLNGVAAAGKSVANDIVTAAQRASAAVATPPPGSPGSGASSSGGPGTPGSAGTPGTTPGGAPPASTPSGDQSS